ncbi:uncharacterized protein LOC128999083 [Macrosteles quadrilineatus]|uniref:uncharacterized protein LOC128999083 n=1 Tax=Macrosteles quadrilineatus TaxID=74068 RepID=UPI0023E1B2E6|nr:uncharacterized protein LOC128999083 [Macrosteles quadrilineatus]
MLQHSINNISKWCLSNAMELNVSKCVVMFLSRSNLVHEYDYCIDGRSLSVVEKFRDLGVITVPSLSPHDHLIHISSRVSSLLGFIHRSTRSFKSPMGLVTLYKSLARPILEYCSVVWNPYQTGHIEILNRIQTRFLKLLGLKLGFPFLDVPVAALEVHFGLQPLPLRRQVNGIVFLFKVANGIIDCPELLNEVDFHAPRGTRSRAVFRRRYQPTNSATTKYSGPRTIPFTTESPDC